MNKNRSAYVVGGIGCVIIVILLAVLVVFGIAFLNYIGPGGRGVINSDRSPTLAAVRATASPPPTVAPAPRVIAPTPRARPGGQAATGESESLVALYEQVNTGVVSIQVLMERDGVSGQGSGSGFVIDRAGHIVTNNHVVNGATYVTVVFFDGFESEAEVVGTDPDSDLAVIRVEQLPIGARSLPLGDSDTVVPGEPVIAIGNPFGLQGSITRGIVSAVGRTLPTGLTPFSIPQAIQTDAAINPGNSGGPLLNMQGEVVGVNAQIATGGTTRANAGVGFAIPVNVVKLVAPVLIEEGSYSWPWLGVQGTSVSLLLAEANDLDAQDGAYIAAIVPDGPAEAAGMQGSSGSEAIRGLQVPVGGDVIIEADGQPIKDFSALLVHVAFKQPGDNIDLVVVRGGRRVSVVATLQARPNEVGLQRP